ncbi:MAG: hypothetical protein ABL999_06420 [Pyrinomonadaceae bacterium]
MKVLLKLYSISCIVVVAFFAFFMVPWGIMPFSDAVNLMIIGGLLVGATGFYTIYFYRREGLELGWFLLFRGGFWVITVACIGVAALVCGALLLIWPDLFANVLEQGALPFGILLVSLFWLGLIFLLAYPAFGMAAQTAAYARDFKFTQTIIHAVIALVCTALSAVFFSLFLEVLNDILARISIPTQWKAIRIFVGLLMGSGLIYGLWKGPDLLREADNKDGAE